MIERLNLTEKQIQEASHIVRKITVKFKKEMIGVVDVAFILSGDFDGPTYIFAADSEKKDSYYFQHEVEASIYNKDKVYEQMNLYVKGMYDFSNV
jgi:hypothetical protein